MPPLGSPRRSPTTIAPAIAAGADQAPGLDLVLLDLDPALARLHYDVVSNGVLWFLHHGMFDLVRRPRFDHRFHDAWAGYVEVNATFATCRGRDCERRRGRARAGLPARARARADSRRASATSGSCTSPTRRSADRTRSGCCPPRLRTQLVSAMAAMPCGFHTQRWARAYAASAREMLGPDTEVADVRRVVRDPIPTRCAPMPRRLKPSPREPSSTTSSATGA